MKCKLLVNNCPTTGHRKLESKRLIGQQRIVYAYKLHGYNAFIIYIYGLISIHY